MLNIWWQIYGNQSVYDFVKQAKPRIVSPLFQRAPTKLSKHFCDTCLPEIIVKCPPSCPTLDHLDFIDAVICVGAPNRGCIFHQWAHQGLVCHFTYGWGFVLMLRLMNPRDRFAEVQIFWIWLLKVKLLLISTPKYLELPTDSRICPCSRYSLGTGFTARVT